MNKGYQNSHKFLLNRNIILIAIKIETVNEITNENFYLRNFTA